MNLLKLCPACGEKNPVFEVICRACMTNLSSVSPTPAEAEKKTPPTELSERVSGPEEAMTVRAEIPPCRVLTLLRPDGRPVPAADGVEIGRNAHYAGLFDDVKTVSRRHAKVFCRAGQWEIEDLGSTNGTWVNGRRLAQGEAHPLKVGDTVRLSLSCELKVIA